MNLTVYPDARVVVTVPPRISKRTILNFISEYTDWVHRQLIKIKRADNCVLLPGGRHDYLRHKEQARNLIQQVIAKHSCNHAFDFNRLAIKNLFGSWGSCSAKRNLNFNYKLIHLPPHLAEYIVVHELCHLGQMNHSKRFWLLVARLIPDYQKRKKELRKYLM
ncbi:M48 family metallopeptidase [Patescibacteria group bacterium]|nr:M48 family metallopeptidase [Patescibacteria group bacterium]